MLNRIFDISLSLIFFIILLPFIIVIAIFIKMDSKGPVFYKQRRVGKDGKLFWIYKFRTMFEDAKPFKLRLNPSNIKDYVFPPPPDEEITNIGRFLRSTSLNEIPQLINVLKGEMSLVGPRPELPEIVEKYPPEYRKRLKVKPGITGLAQIKGRGILTIEEIVKYDLEYVDNKSFLLDLKILFKTVKTVLSREGAY